MVFHSDAHQRIQYTTRMAGSHSVILERTCEQGLSCEWYYGHTEEDYSSVLCTKSQMDKPELERIRRKMNVGLQIVD